MNRCLDANPVIVFAITIWLLSRLITLSNSLFVSFPWLKIADPLCIRCTGVPNFFNAQLVFSGSCI